MHNCGVDRNAILQTLDASGLRANTGHVIDSKVICEAILTAPESLGCANPAGQARFPTMIRRAQKGTERGRKRAGMDSLWLDNIAILRAVHRNHLAFSFKQMAGAKSLCTLLCT